MAAEKLTLGMIRELTAGLPDETPVLLDVRCGESDQFHAPLPLDSYLHVGNPQRRDQALYLSEVCCTAADTSEHLVPAGSCYRVGKFGES
jgi:hypothetical protein